VLDFLNHSSVYCCLYQFGYLGTKNPCAKGAWCQEKDSNLHINVSPHCKSIILYVKEQIKIFIRAIRVIRANLVSSAGIEPATYNFKIVALPTELNRM
jgi:hypothetical protein